VRGKAYGASPSLNHQFIQEYPMATSAAAVKEDPATTFAKDQLKAIIERIERLEEEKKTISDDIRDVYCRGQGQRLRRQGAAHHRAPAQAGRQ